MDNPTVIAAAIATAIVTVLAALSAAIVAVIAAVASAKERVIAAEERKALKASADLAASKVEVVAKSAEQIAVRAIATENKLDQIKSTTEQAAKDVDGNLKNVREDLAKQTALSKSLQDTVTALTQILVDVQKRGPRVTDVPAAPAPAAVAPAHVETMNVESNTVNLKKGK